MHFLGLALTQLTQYRNRPYSRTTNLLRILELPLYLLYISYTFWTSSSVSLLSLIKKNLEECTGVESTTHQGFPSANFHGAPNKIYPWKNGAEPPMRRWRQLAFTILLKNLFGDLKVKLSRLKVD